MTLDHVKTRATGGTNHESNLITACLKCNASRRDKKVFVFADGKAVARINRNRRRKLKRHLVVASEILSI